MEKDLRGAVRVAWLHRRLFYIRADLRAGIWHLNDVRVTSPALLAKIDFLDANMRHVVPSRTSNRRPTERESPCPTTPLSRWIFDNHACRPACLHANLQTPPQKTSGPAPSQTLAYMIKPLMLHVVALVHLGDLRMSLFNK